MNTSRRSLATARALLALFVLATVLAAGRPARAAGIIYVVPGGAGSQTGADWANAKTLTAALAAATNGDEVWVKSGTYKPAGPGGDRAATFALQSGVKVYGGFAGAEILRSQRNANPATNGTVLNGDLNGDDNDLRCRQRRERLSCGDGERDG